MSVAGVQSNMSAAQFASMSSGGSGSSGNIAGLGHRAGLADSGLTTNGLDMIFTGRYLITVQEGRAKVYDTETNTWFEVWGDPHLRTSDGDKGQFHVLHLGRGCAPDLPNRF